MTIYCQFVHLLSFTFFNATALSFKISSLSWYSIGDRLQSNTTIVNPHIKFVHHKINRKRSTRSAPIFVKIFPGVTEETQINRLWLILSLRKSILYTCLRKRCRVNCVNNGQCDTMELWKERMGKFVTGYHFLIFKIFFPRQFKE